MLLSETVTINASISLTFLPPTILSSPTPPIPSTTNIQVSNNSFHFFFFLFRNSLYILRCIMKTMSCCLAHAFDPVPLSLFSSNFGGRVSSRKRGGVVVHSEFDGIRGCRYQTPRVGAGNSAKWDWKPEQKQQVQFAQQFGLGCSFFHKCRYFHHHHQGFKLLSQLRLSCNPWCCGQMRLMWLQLQL